MTHYLKANSLQLIFVALLVMASLLGVMPDALADGALLAAGAGTIARTATVMPVPTDPALVAIAQNYRNKVLVADLVLPRVTVGKQEFKWNEFGKTDSFTLPKTRVGRKGRPTVVEVGGTERVGSCEWDALDAEVPQDDIDNAPPGYSPVNHHTMVNTNLIHLQREVRVAAAVFNGANYGAGNKDTVTGNDRWFHADSRPLDQLEASKDDLVMSPNRLLLGRKAWRHLRSNPQIVSSILGNSGTQGKVSRQQVAELLEIDEVIVGEGLLNIAKTGQDPELVRVWGNHALLFHLNPEARTEGIATFGVTAAWGGWYAAQWFDQNIGVKGGQCARVGECTQEVVIAPDLGFFLENVGDDT